jgi:hypothetical protein
MFQVLSNQEPEVKALRLIDLSPILNFSQLPRKLTQFFDCQLSLNQLPTILSRMQQPKKLM